MVNPRPDSRDTNRPAPAASRPDLTQYGISQDTEGMLPWDYIDEQMAAARNYWLGTTRPDGRPHVVPVWGVWIGQVLYFGSQTNAVKARNLAQNPAIVIHLESGDDVVILEGTAKRLVAMHPDLYQRLAADYARKYDGFKPNPPSDAEPLYAVYPTLALGWKEYDFVRTPTRWRLGTNR
ncbi:MAG: pyridoxamine 5'-phosphate oxidase [Chloroflexi bacterium]|nr:pyridoxamine 5'-phosphate oxidase [Chloroflexota bacterium]